MSKSTTLTGLLTQEQPEPMMSRKGQVVLGGFEIVGKLGEGAYATAYRARQIGMDRDAVIKIARDHLLSGQHAELIRNRFDIEVRASSRIKHPNVVTIYTAGQIDGAPALAMEYVEGETLDDLLRAYAPLGETVFVTIFSKLASALAALHEVGIVHRDVSSNNIMVSRRAGELEPKLLDFGISQLDGSGLQTAGPIGTPQFMAPEMLRGVTSPAVDVFSLGLLMWWAASGELFMPPGANQFEIFKLLSSMKGPPQLTASFNHLSLELRQLVQAALDPDPERRPSAADLVARFDARSANMRGSAELLALDPSITTFDSAPTPLKVLVIEHPDAASVELGRALPTRGFELHKIPMARWRELIGSLPSFDLVVCPLPSRRDSPARTHLLSLLFEREQRAPDLTVYGYGDTILPKRTLESMGVEESWVLPMQAVQMRQALERLARTNISGQWTRIDSDMLSRSLEEDSVFTRDMLDEFIGQMPEWLLELEECLDYEDTKGLFRVCGELSSRASAIGAERMLMLSRELCALHRSLYLTDGARLIEEIEEEYKNLFIELNALRQNAN